MLFNVKVAFSDKSSGDIDILGMKISVSVPRSVSENTKMAEKCCVFS